jgi:hypothetical protein
MTPGGRERTETDFRGLVAAAGQCDENRAHKIPCQRDRGVRLKPPRISMRRWEG